MRYLLDTHAFLWFGDGNTRLPLLMRASITDTSGPASLSIASLWEIAIKISTGKLALTPSFDGFIQEALRRGRIQLFPITFPHTALIATLPFHHRDPFDRLLIAQALAEDIPIISADPQFDAYGAARLW
jgi:PIN domain nuclease of toxin-antitoxin system